MKDQGMSRRTLFYLAALLALVLGRPAAAQQVERERDDLRITAVDTSAFPTVAVRVLTTTAGSAPIADLSRLALRENGVPVPDATATPVPVGVDVVMVLDANSDFLQFDDSSGVSRRDKTAASIARFAGQFMNQAGPDRVSIITPDESGAEAAFLARDATRPDDVIAAVNAYNPIPPRVTPLQAMLTAAVEHLAAADGERFGAVLLYTDGARLNSQLDYPAVVEAAQAAGVPIYVAILGAEASADEIANAAGLYSPTNGRYVHMPEPDAADPIYEIFRAQGAQTELSYRSALRQNGRHEVSVSVGNVRDAAEFDLSLVGPEVALSAPETIVRRVGSAVDTPLPLLQPAVLPLTVEITWPDGRARRLTEIAFRADGAPQPLAADARPDESGRMSLLWDISERDAGTYRLEVDIADELGFRATTAPLDVTIEIARPSPPTPTVAPTRAPLIAPAARASVAWGALLLPLLLAGGALAAILARRRRGRPAPPPEPPPRIIPATNPPDDNHVAVLEWPGGGEAPGDRIELTAADVTLGREADAVDIVIDEPTVSRLHARIRRNAAGEYWLFDEGSAGGTFLNYEQLGLAPRRLEHGDTIRLGRVALRFRLELPGRPSVTDDDSQPAV